MDDVVQHVGRELGMHAADVVQRVGGEEPRRAVIGVLVLFARHRDRCRPELADDARELLREVFAAILGIGHHHLRLWRPIEARVRRAIRAALLGPVAMHELAEAAVRKTQKRRGRRIEPERTQPG